MQILPTVRQVEFYLSPTNLPYDTHLNHHIDPQGWFPLSLIVTYPRMQKLCATDPYQVALALRVYSTLVVVDSTASKIRPNWHYLPNHALYEPQPPVQPEQRRRRHHQQQQQQQQHSAPDFNRPVPQNQPNTLHWLYPTTVVMYPIIATQSTHPFPSPSNYQPLQPRYNKPPPSNSKTPTQRSASSNTSTSTPRQLRRKRRFAKTRNHNHANPRPRSTSPRPHSTAHQPTLAKSDFPPLHASSPSDPPSSPGKDTPVSIPVKKGWASVVKASNGKVRNGHVQHVVHVGDAFDMKEGGEQKQVPLGTEKLHHDIAGAPNSFVEEGMAKDVNHNEVRVREDRERNGSEGEAVVKRTGMQEGSLEMTNMPPREGRRADEHAVRAEVLGVRADQRTRADARAEEARLQEAGEHGNESGKTVVQQASASEGNWESADVSQRLGRQAEDHAFRAVHEEGKDDLTADISPSLNTRESTLSGNTFSSDGEPNTADLSSPAVDTVGSFSVPSSKVWANAPRSLFMPPPTLPVHPAFSPRRTQSLQVLPRDGAPAWESPSGGRRVKGNLRGRSSQLTEDKVPSGKLSQLQRQPPSSGTLSSPRVRNGRSKRGMQQRHERRLHNERNGTIVATRPTKVGEGGPSYALAGSKHRNECGLRQKRLSNSKFRGLVTDDNNNPFVLTPIREGSSDDVDKVAKTGLDWNKELSRTTPIKPTQAGLSTIVDSSEIKDVAVINASTNGVKIGEEPPIDQPHLQVQVASVARVAPMVQPSSTPRPAVSMSATGRM